MPIKGTNFLLTSKGDLAIDILKVVNAYIRTWDRVRDAKIEVVEVLDWIAGEVVKDEVI